MSGLQMKYFVLKPGDNDVYGMASRAAMEVYAHCIKDENRELSQDIMEWVAREREIVWASQCPNQP